MSEMIKITEYRHWKQPTTIYKTISGLAFHKRGDPIIIKGGKFAGEYTVQEVKERMGTSFPKVAKKDLPKELQNKHSGERAQKYIKEILLAPKGQGLDINKYYRRSDPITLEVN